MPDATPALPATPTDAPFRAKVASLWIGGRLCWLEQLCIQSFLDHGHQLTIYSYDALEGVPSGARVEDARTILSGDEVLTHKATGSSALHSDLFRYRLLERTDEIWVDLDMLCMRPWIFPNGHVYGWEKPGRLVCGAALGLPRNSPTLAALLAFCETEHPIPPWLLAKDRADLEAAHERGEPVHVSDLRWGVWGPDALTYFLTKTGEVDNALPQSAFFPISFAERRSILKPGRDLSDRITDETYGVHLWNRRIRRRLMSHHNGVPPEGSFLWQAMMRHGIDPSLAPIPDVPPPARSAAQTATPKAPAEQGDAQELFQNLAFLAADELQAEPPAAMRAMPIRRPAPSPHGALADALEARLDARAAWLAPPASPVPQKPSIVAVTTMRNEAPFILEWIAYNRLIGIEHTLVYTNGCADPTVPLLDRLAALGHVTRLDNPFDPAGKVKPQHAALNDAKRQKVVRKADWLAVIDVDEFIAVHAGDGTLHDLLRATNYPNAISLTWRFFGNGGVAEYVDEPVTRQFTRCAPEFMENPGMAWGFKTLFKRNETGFHKLGVHRPLRPQQATANQVRWINGSGRVMPARLIEAGWRTVKPIFGYRLASLNHYALRSADSYLVKRERGRVNHTAEDQGLYYWQRRNYIADRDERMTFLMPRLEEELARLKSDPELADLHAQAVAWHRARIDRLKQDENYARLHAELLRTAEIDANDFIADINPEDEPELQRIETPPPPVPGA